MKVVIIEDEKPAARRLERLIAAVRPGTEIMAVIDTIEDAVSFFNSCSTNPPDLVFMDIHLADGLSFEIFNQTRISAPVIFTTAFDHYAVKAFKVNSIDYLLKPIEQEDLYSAIKKYEGLKTGVASAQLTDLLKSLEQPQEVYRKRFLVKTAGRIAFVNVEDVGYFFSEGGNTFLVTNDGERFLLDTPLDEIEPGLDPIRFFRINRAMIISSPAIRKIDPHFNNRYSLELNPPFDGEALVSRQRGQAFRLWLDT